MSESIVIALIGVAGAVIGSIATVAVQLLSHKLQEREVKERDRPKKELLLKMLNSPNSSWRTLETLRHVIGADEETAKRLLLEVGARASENGKNVWGLLDRNPLPDGD